MIPEQSKIIGNAGYADQNLGFKADVRNICDKYATEGVSLPYAMNLLLGNEQS